jgi:hypothetical protein
VEGRGVSRGRSEQDESTGADSARDDGTSGAHEKSSFVKTV